MGDVERVLGHFGCWIGCPEELVGLEGGRIRGTGCGVVVVTLGVMLVNTCDIRFVESVGRWLLILGVWRDGLCHCKPSGPRFVPNLELVSCLSCCIYDLALE